MTVKIQSRGLPNSLSFIPALLEQWFTSSGRRASWQRNTPENLSILWGKGMEPITRDVIEDHSPPEVQKACLGEKGKRGALFFNPDGHVQSFDCILCVQPIDEHTAQMAAIDERRRLVEDGKGYVKGLEDEMQQLLSQAGRQSGDPVLTGEVKTAAQHTVVSKDLRTNVKIG